MAFSLYSRFCKCAKRVRRRKKKHEETKPIFEVAYLGNAGSDFAQIWNVGVLKLEGVSTAKIVLFHQGSTELRRCENCVFVLPVNILTGVARRLLGPHDTLPCVLIIESRIATLETSVRSLRHAHKQNYPQICITYIRWPGKCAYK